MWWSVKRNCRSLSQKGCCNNCSPQEMLWKESAWHAKEGRHRGQVRDRQHALVRCTEARSLVSHRENLETGLMRVGHQVAPTKFQAWLLCLEL